MDFSLQTALHLDLPSRLSPRKEARLAAGFEGRLAGIDEAGRGPWAGPVSVAAVILDHKALPRGLDDSKALAERDRERLYDEILASATVAIAFASPKRIDALNIRAATLEAMTRAVRGFSTRPAACLIDGRDVPPGLPCPGQAVVKGDARILCIAAASIVAKVARDRLMRRMEAVHPGYGFAAHKGYGTAAHADALDRLGPCPLHRRSFRPVRAWIEAATGDST
ncbi:ribonuclease HII [Stappia sp. MMSF_3263]|uniref:ribonuclease HII n=1 Tax=Stappia sp. MMSF_3263 TaxID=3046693 RepID=UPI00273F49E3|nr:ribonuclease HII [Stappia sp. MMSF_3263]